MADNLDTTLALTGSDGLAFGIEVSDIWDKTIGSKPENNKIMKNFENIFIK
jgi:hypothetical protein